MQNYIHKHSCLHKCTCGLTQFDIHVYICTQHSVHMYRYNYSYIHIITLKEVKYILQSRLK